MARPERNNVDYFPLYVDNGRKMFFIETKYGNDGFATWIKILSELAKANYHYLNLKDDTQKMYLSALCKVDEATLNNIINDLVKLGEFDRKLWENGIIFSEKFVQSISDAYKKRTNKPVSLLSLVTLLRGLGVLKHSYCIENGPHNPHTIVKDTIVKESKLDGACLKYVTYCNETIKKYGKKRNWKVSLKIKKNYPERIKEGYTSEDFAKAIQTAMSDHFHKETNYKHLTPEFFCRQDKLEKYANL